MNWKALYGLALGTLSAGWLLPLGWSISLYMDYLDLIYLPLVQGHTPLASAPLGQMALTLFHIACAWLFAVIVAWTLVAHRALRRLSDGKPRPATR